jgi:hypothetical protein
MKKEEVSIFDILLSDIDFLLFQNCSFTESLRSGEGADFADGTVGRVT